MHCVYVLQHTETKQFYFGKTSNLSRRIAQHNACQQKSTKRREGTWILVYAEAYRDKTSADRREQRIKDHGRAKQELLKRIRESCLP
jgi:predicted GIY-YIG superfamily endonuclease